MSSVWVCELLLRFWRMLWTMERFFLLFLTLLIWRGSSGFAVWNQKPAQYWQGVGPVTQTVQGSGPLTQIPQSSSQAGASVSASPVLHQSYDQSASGSSWFGSLGQSVSPVSLTQNVNAVPQTVQSSSTQTQVSQSSPQSGSSVSASNAHRQSHDQSASGSSWFGSLGQRVSPVSQTQISKPVPQTVQGSLTQTQVSQSLPQSGSRLSASTAQQQSYDQPASGSSWFGSLGQWAPPASQVQTLSPVLESVQGSGPQVVSSALSPSAQQQSFGQPAVGSLSQRVPLVSQTQNLSPVPQIVQGSGSQTQVPPSSPQVGVSALASPAQQQSFGQSAGGSSWFVPSSQGVPPVSQALTFNPVLQTVPITGTLTQFSQSSPQAGASASAFPSLQQNYDQSSTAVQAQLTRPVPASGSVANVLTTAQGFYGLQSSGSPSWITQPQRPSSVLTQFQPSQNAGQVFPGTTSSGSSKWLKVSPPALNPSWSSGTPSAWVPATNNLFASLSQVAAPSFDATFQSGGLGSAFQTSGFSTNSATGSLTLSQTSSVPSSLMSSRPLPGGVLPSTNLVVSSQGPLNPQSTGSSQSVLQGSASVVPAVQSNPLSSTPSRLSSFLPGATSSVNFVPGPNSQASSPYTQIPAVRVPSNQQNLGTQRTSGGTSVLRGSSSSVKG